MYIGNVLIDRCELDYSEMNCCTEIEQYQQGVAGEMYNKHIRKITQTGRVPIFYVDNVPSRMNDIDFDVPTMEEVRHEIRLLKVV